MKKVCPHPFQSIDNLSVNLFYIKYTPDKTSLNKTNSIKLNRRITSL